MDDQGFFFLLCLGIIGVNSFGAADFKPGTTVQKYTTEIFVQKKSRVVLDCSIRTQSHDMLYSWTKDGQELVSQKQRLKDGQDIIPQRRRHNWDLKSQGRISLAENGSLIIERVINKKKKGLSDEGFYECIGESTLGTVIGRRVIIKIERPAFTIIPQDEAASVGGVARFQCQVNIQSVLYVWRPLEGRQVQTDNSRITSFTGIYQLTNVTQEDAGTYICQAFPSFDKTLDIMEKTATLTVMTDPLPVLPRFLNTSRNIRVRVGDPALLECLAEGQEKIKFFWYKGESLLKEEPSRVTVVGNTNIKFRSTNSSDTGSYTCMMEVGDEVFERVYNLEVLVPPRITTAPRVISNKLLVQRTRWSCVATGYPEPTISWFKDGLKLYPAPSLQLKNELVLNGQFEDSGYYQCLAENEAGIDVATAYIRFNRKPDTPDKPRNVKAIPISSTEVNVTWSLAVTQGGFDVMAYGIDFHEVHELTCDGKCAHLFDRKREVSKGNFKVVRDLKPYTEYSFAVQGYSGNGAGLLSGEVIVRTLEAVPTTVPNIQITPDSMSSFRVTWTEIPPEHCHGVIDRYKLCHGTKEKMNVIELRGDSRSYLVTGLEPDTVYRVRVLAGNSAGYPYLDNNEKLWVEYRTPRADPSVHPTPKLNFDAINSSSVMIDWNCNMFYTVGSYRITVQKLLESSAVQEINISSDSCEYLLTGLENNTFYKIEFMVKDLDNKAIGVVTESYQSLAPGMKQQPPPPMDVDLQLLTSSEITLSWRKPKTSMKITKYTVMYRRRMDESNIFHIIESPTLFARLEGLSPFTWYLIAVRSHADSAEGPFSKPVIVQTKEGIPSPPENLLAEVVSPGTVRLQWGPPRKQNGIIRFYIIYYNVDKDQPEQVWSSIQQNASTTTVVVQDLKSKVYYFKLRACTNAGEGMTSHVVAIDTLACSQAPCPQCQPPQECTDAAPDASDSIVSSILQQKLGIIIGCSIGLTCIALCVIFVWRYRCLSRRPRLPNPETLSASCSDSVGRHLSQPIRSENGGFVRYSPISKGMEENKNSDTKGGDYILIKNSYHAGDKVVLTNGIGSAYIDTSSQIPLENGHVLQADERGNDVSENISNQNPDATETSPFLEPAGAESLINENVNLNRDTISVIDENSQAKIRCNDNTSSGKNFGEKHVESDNTFIENGSANTADEISEDAGNSSVHQKPEEVFMPESKYDDKISANDNREINSCEEESLEVKSKGLIEESFNSSESQVDLEDNGNEVDEAEISILGKTVHCSESKKI